MFFAKTICLSILLSCFLTAAPKANGELKLQDFSKYEPSFEKDFFIYYYLRQKQISPSQADEAFYQTNKVNSKIFGAWAKHSPSPDIKQILKCQRIAQVKSVDNVDCLTLALNANMLFGYHEDKVFLKRLLDLFVPYANKHEDYAEISTLLQALLQDNFAQKVLKNEPLFLDLFGKISYQNIKKHFNQPMSEKKINSLATSSYPFSAFVQKIATNPELEYLQKSLLVLVDSNKLTLKSYWFLGLNALKYKKNKLAEYYLLSYYKKTNNIEDKNKALFWLYRITNDKLYFDSLAKSYYLDLYSLYAQMQMQIFPDVVSVINEDKTMHKPPFIEGNPMEYLRYQDKIDINNQELKYIGTLPYLVREYEKYFAYKKNFFYIPKYIQKVQATREQKAMLLAIARQESRFIPTAISSSFAAGVMQILPFVSEEIAIRSGYDYDAFAMFDPKTSVKFADFHLKILSKHLIHPLFIAYGYSNGMGFTKSVLRREYFGSGEYEPYLSMELMPNNQARKYGKNVLANYIIYLNLLGTSETLNQSVVQIDKKKVKY